MTGSLEQAVDGAGVVAVTVPTAFVAYAAALARVTAGGQLIWLNPGHSGGALYLAAELARAGRGRAHDLPADYRLARQPGDSRPATVRVFLRSRASLAALPASHLQACHRRLDALLPGQFGPGRERARGRPGEPQRDLAPAGDGMQCGLDPGHRGKFGFYAEGSGPAVARVMDAI